MTSPQKRGLTATTLAAYHHFQCDLFLHNTYNTPSRRGKGSGQPELPELTKATLSRGNNWESNLFSWLDDNRLLLRVYGGFLDGDGIREVIAVDERDHFFVAGLSFLPPAEFFERKFRERGHNPVQFGIAKPDLIEVRRQGNDVLWRVIDAKSSGNVKTSHHVQIYFYHICLEGLLDKAHYKPMGTSAVWIPPQDWRTSGPSFDGLRTISVSLLSLPLEAFLFSKLPEIVSKERADVGWHFNPLCRGCPFQGDCSSRAVSHGKIGAIADISLQDEAVLRSILTLVRSKGNAPQLQDIEELDKTIRSRAVMQELGRFHLTTVKKTKRILKLINRPNNTDAFTSPLVDAALTKQVQVIGKRIFSMPCDEDIALMISLVLDPATEDVIAYCITMFTGLHGTGFRQPISGSMDTFLHSLYQVVQHILDLNDVLDTPPRTQCYMFSLAERAALQRFLINAALTADPKNEDQQEYVRVCIGTLCEGASLLATSFQPLILSGALLDFLGKRGERSAEDLRTCLRRLSLPTGGKTVEELRQRIEDEVERLKTQGKRTVGSNNLSDAEGEGSGTRPEIGQLPRIVVLKTSVERLLALPIPGYWDLQDCHRVLATSSRLLCPSNEEIYSAYVAGTGDVLTALLRKRNVCLYEVLSESRSLVTMQHGTKDILVNEARTLTSEFMDICRQDHLRKLLFMQQFEVLSRLQTIWQDRIDGCVDAPRLEYQYTHRQANITYTHFFSLISGYVDLPSDKERSFYGYILTEETDNSSDLPIETLFDDLTVFNVFFPLNKFTRHRWEKQPRAVQDSVFIADVQDIHVGDNNRTLVKLRTSGDINLRLKPHATYRLSPRLVDFNVTKILSTLVEIDLQTPPSADYVITPPFSQLFSHTTTFAKEWCEWESVSGAFLKAETQAQALYRELESLNNQAAASLLLKSSQRKALRRILRYRLSVIWGPPGTGKTYTISLSLLRYLEIRHNCAIDGQLFIFLTAMTHAAIDACLSKVNTLIQHYRAIPGLAPKWLDKLKIERVFAGGTHPLPKGDKTYIYAGTVYQVYNFTKRSMLKADCVVIDEAGQLGLGPASLVLRSLKPSGRVIVAGDSEQLAPILTSRYPQPEHRLFGSILDSLMNLSDVAEDDVDLFIDTDLSSFSESSQVSTIVQLTENFRLNPDLGEFVSTIYKKSFKPQKAQTRKIADQLGSLKSLANTSSVQDRARDILVALSFAMRRRDQTILSSPRIRGAMKLAELFPDAILFDARNISLLLIDLSVSTQYPDQVGYETHVRAEAFFASALVRLFQAAAPEDAVFVATPHRIQRHAVKDALRTKVDELVDAFGILNIAGDIETATVSTAKVTIDTIERLQGSEASFVICLFAHTHPASASTAIDFLLERRRLNVAISRAKTLCVLVASKEVLRPSVRIFSNPQSAKGFAFLKAYEDRAWSAEVNIDLDEVNAL